MIANRECLVNLSTLTKAPYNLVLDEEVWVKVIASNVYGDSVLSVAGNGALTKLVPDAPINLANIAALTDATSISFAWQDGTSDGGRPVLDYRVFFDQANGNFIELETGVLTQQYSTSIALVPDLEYVFKVQARNDVGFSLDSTTITIRAARIPDKPENLANDSAITTAYQIGITWEAPLYDGGSQILDYKLSFKAEADAEFSVYQDSLETRAITVTGLSPGVTYLFFVTARNVVGESPNSDVLSVLAA